ncbi:MAG: CopG family transcriptional regulator [Acidobacteria bacterium]|nr:CopG family transcriptional regulator [Acidobacteriota bacterium]
MKNVTIVLDEKVAKWLRVRAAEHDSSVSRYVGEILRQMMENERSYGTARRDFFAIEARSLREPGEPLPTREDLYDRDRS